MLSKRKILENIQELKQKIDDFTPAESVNNIYRMQALEAAIDAQVGRSAVLDNTIYYNRWLILNQWTDYMVNTFNYECEDYEHVIFINRAMRYAFLYGYVYVYNNNGKPEIVGIQEIGGRYVGYTITADADVSEKGVDYYKTLNYQKGFTIDESKLIKYQFTSLGYSAFITLQPIIKLEQLASKALYNEELFLPTRVINSSETPDPNNGAARQILDFNSGMLHKYKDGTDTFEPLDLVSLNPALLATIEYAKNYYYDLLGRRTNSDYKTSHNLNAEIEAGQDNFRILERDRYIHLKHFLRQYSKLFNQKIILETTAGDYKDVNEPDVLRNEMDKGGDDVVERNNDSRVINR